MTLHFHPLAFGVMLVVAAGTLVYTLWNSNRNSPYDNRNYPEFDFDDVSSTNSIYGPERPKKKRNADRCAICLGTLKSSLKTLTCAHIFHEHCIQTWLVSNNTCPICRRAPA